MAVELFHPAPGRETQWRGDETISGRRRKSRETDAA
jgi:hypothetical protein